MEKVFKKLYTSSKFEINEYLLRKICLKISQLTFSRHRGHFVQRIDYVFVGNHRYFTVNFGKYRNLFCKVQYSVFNDVLFFNFKMRLRSDPVVMTFLVGHQNDVNFAGILSRNQWLLHQGNGSQLQSNYQNNPKIVTSGKDRM